MHTVTKLSDIHATMQILLVNLSLLSDKRTAMRMSLLVQVYLGGWLVCMPILEALITIIWH